MCGIYQIICLVTGESYIGSTINLYFRYKQHESQLNNNTHYNKNLQEAWNKYGKEYFDWNVIEYCTLINLSNKEQYYIDLINPEYNICKIIESRLIERIYKKIKEKEEEIKEKEIKEMKLNFSPEEIQDIRTNDLFIKENAEKYNCSTKIIEKILRKELYNE